MRSHRPHTHPSPYAGGDRGIANRDDTGRPACAANAFSTSRIASSTLSASARRAASSSGFSATARDRSASALSAAMDADNFFKPWSSAGSDDVDSSTDRFRRNPGCVGPASRAAIRAQRLVLRLQAAHVLLDAAPRRGYLCFRHLLHSARIDG